MPPGVDSAPGPGSPPSEGGDVRPNLSLLCLLAGVALTPMARAAQPAAANGVFTLRLENDALNGTDRYYTAGEHLGWTSAPGQVPDGLAALARRLWGPGRQRIALGLTQLLFTPENTQIIPPNPHDRPYAGLLLAGASLIEDNAHTRNVLGLDLGVIGPAALGADVQNGFHTVLGETTTSGWSAQLPNQPVVELTGQRLWRLPLARPGRFEIDAVPEVAVGLGTWRIYAETGAVLRFGQGLDADFGAPPNRPGLSGDDAYTPTRRISWYVFVGVDGQAVGWDETLNGEPFRATRHVTLQPLLGEVEAGVSVIAFGVRASFVHVVQTQSFRHQRGGLFQYDSATISIPF